MKRISIGSVRIADYYAKLSLRSKIALPLFLALYVLGTLALGSLYLSARHQLTEQTNKILESRAKYEKREIELRIRSLTSLAESISNNSATANALADSVGREIYLKPMFESQRIDVVGANLVLLDYRNRPQLSSIPTKTDYESVLNKIERNNEVPYAEVLHSANRDAELIIVYPVLYRLTNNIEGGVLLSIPLGALIDSDVEPDEIVITDAGGVYLSRSNQQGTEFSITKELELASPLDQLHLRLKVSTNQSDLITSLRFLLIGFLIIFAIATALVVWIVSITTNLITKPITDLVAAAESIADSGRPVAKLESYRLDEIGRVTNAFNTMVERLAASYSELEERVALRTQELEKSNQIVHEAKEMLVKREKYLRATIDNLPFFFWLKDSDCRFLAVNKIFAEACGRESPQQLVGLTDFDVWPKELAQMYRADDLQVMSSMREKTVEEPIQDAKGCHWIETYKKPVFADDGSLLGTVGFSRDVTDRREMLEALTQSETRWKLAMSGSNDGMFDWKPQEGTCYFSDRWKSMLGYESNEISNSDKEWSSRIHPDDLIVTMEKVQALLLGESDHYECEHRMRCRNGEYKWILARGKAIFDERGNAIRVSGSHTDIADRRKYELKMQENSEQLGAIFSMSPDGFVSFGQDGHVKYVNPAFEEITGLETNSVMAVSESEFSKILSNLCIPQARFNGISALRAMRHVAGNIQEDPRQKIELFTARRVIEVGLRESNSETISALLYLRDITHETEVDRMKSEFLSTAAHELRTPMSSIYGFSELLLNQPFSVGEQQELISTIYKQSNLMISIINELLDLARIESRRGKDFVISSVNVGELIHDVIKSFVPPVGRPSPKLKQDGQSVLIRADRNKLIQALNNVISNSYKYSPNGGEVSIELVKSTSPQASVMVGVRIVDVGIGMTPDQLSHVFDRFYRADSSGKIPGTGLGMSIVKEIIDLHGGSLSIESAIGTGTSVTIWLPINITVSDDLLNGLEAHSYLTEHI